MSEGGAKTDLRTLAPLAWHDNCDAAAGSAASGAAHQGAIVSTRDDPLLLRRNGTSVASALASMHLLARARRTALIAAQLRAFDRRLDDRPGVVLAANGVLDRHPADLQALDWHLLVADEALRHLRLACVADCWLLTATDANARDDRAPGWP